MREKQSKEPLQNEIGQTVLLAQQVLSAAKARLAQEQNDTVTIPFKVIQGRWPHRLQWQYLVTLTQSEKTTSVSIGNPESHFGQNVVVSQSDTQTVVQTQTYGQVVIAKIILQDKNLFVQNAWMPLTEVETVTASSRGVLDQARHMQRELVIARQAIQHSQKTPLSL